jgi:hypothetical protein
VNAEAGQLPEENGLSRGHVSVLIASRQAGVGW